MTRDEEVAKYLNDHAGEYFCDDCIANAVGINRYQASNATRPLGTTSDFTREKGVCSQCSKLKLKKVIKAVKAAAG